MSVKKKMQPDAEIDVGAFSDIAFLLIIFFILTTSFIKMTGQEMSIPSGEATDAKNQPKQLTINLSPQEIRWGEGDKAPVVSMEALRNKLIQANLKDPNKKDKDRMVILESSKDVPYGRYFKVVSAIADAGGILAIVDTREKTSK